MTSLKRMSCLGLHVVCVALNSSFVCILTALIVSSDEDEGYLQLFIAMEYCPLTLRKVGDSNVL